MSSLATENAKRSKAWPRVKLGEVCEINLGKTPPRGNGRYWDAAKTSGFKWLSISDLLNSYDGKVNDSKEYITEAAVCECGVPVVKKGIFLLSFKLTLGRTAIAGCDLYTNEAIAALPLKAEYKEAVDLVYLSYYCKYFDWDEFASRDEKVLGKTLNKKKLAEVPVCLPPLDVQYDIAGRLENKLNEIENFCAAAEEGLQTAALMRKAILKEAFA